jgi:adenylate kinase
MVILLGVAGSGKSVQGKLIAKALNCEYFSTGEFLRQNVDPVIVDKMRTGTLIDDPEVIRATQEALLSNGYRKEFVLDGFLRTVPQAEWLIKEVKKGDFKVTAVINLVASPETIVQRLLNRKRPDDQLEIIKKRLNEYNKAINPIVSALESAGIKVNNVDANRAVEEVNKDVMNIIGPSS